MPHQIAPAPADAYGSAAVRRLLIALLLCQLILLAFSIPGHPLHIDEAWIGEQTYHLARDGYVHSALFAEHAGSDAVLVLYHRLFVLTGSIAVKAFGWDILSLRLVAIVAGLGLLAAMALYMRRELRLPVGQMLLALSIMLLIPINFGHLMIYRPEFMMTLFGFLSYWLLERHVQNGQARYAAASGLLAALAALTHLYGLIFLIAAAAMLLRTRRWAGLAILAALALAAFLPYLIDIATHFDLFRAQIASPLAVRKTTFSLATPFLNLLEEHKRLFRTVEIAPVVLLFLLSLALTLKQRNTERRFFYEYTILLVVLLGAIAPDKLVTRYAIPLFPFFAIAIAGALWSIPQRNSAPALIRIPMLVLAAIIMGYGLYFQATTAFSNKQNPEALNAQIGAVLPAGTSCVGPMNLIFNQIERCRILGLYMARKEHADRLTLADAAGFARRHRAAYIVVNRLGTDEERIIDLEEQKNRSDDSLSIIAETDEYLVMKLEE